ncbi:MAG: hypothetical protein RLZZ299_1498 [Pseudomonadota bacterium]|jgi:predicted RNA-binding Zn-ribbon protein involved in translation (DUF1610 family)
MGKSGRWSERWFHRALWLVALVFAGFLIGLGGRVIRDLPRVETTLELEAFLDHDAVAPLRAQLAELEARDPSLRGERDTASLALIAATNDLSQAESTFATWRETRSSTQRADTDPEVLARARELDERKAGQRDAQRSLERIDAELDRLQREQDAARRALAELERVAGDTMERARDAQQLRVFGYRLAVTLPLLALAGWLFSRHRNGPNWPFVWGFILFAAFTFFVELVPHLPSYGGYVRYGVGILVTVAAGRYAIRALQRYVERQQRAEAEPEPMRRERLDYETVMSRLAKGVCPGCERAVLLTNAEHNHCPHCGICLFNRCGRCDARKNAFAGFCHGCGEPAANQGVHAT